jgi:C-terminal processing protease CtpA/Prc
VRITGVLPGTPAAVGKLAENDLILAIDGRPIRTLDEMARILSAFPAGHEVNFSVMRDGRPTKVAVVLGTRPGASERPFANFGAQPEAVESVPAERPKLGVRTVPVNDQSRARLQLPNNEGALVIALSAGSVAEQLGIKLGSVITKVNSTAVKSPEQLVELVGEAANTGTLKIAFVHDGQETVHEVPFGAAPAQPAAIAQPAAGDAQGCVDVDEMTELEAYLDALERRVRDLEDRVAQLEGALAEKNAAQPANAALEAQNEADLDAATDRAAEDE